MVRKVLVVGAGSAGLLAAISLKKKLPELRVRVLRSPDIGVIGVGESTTATFPRFIFDYLGIKRRHFYEIANPTWKLGIHFLWGPRPFFQYGFDNAMDVQWSDLSRPNGFYADHRTLPYINLNNAMMTEGRAFERHADPGRLDIPPWAAFHLFNPTLVASLEVVARDLGITFVTGKLSGAVRGPAGLSAVVLEDGQKIEADLFVDASGFRSELLGRELAEPFVSYESSLFCDRAVVGSWDRGPEDFIFPYTVAETMDAGWCWQIDHEHAVNRGYVYSSRFLSDDDARAEFVRKNPKAKTWDHVVKFRSGRYRRGWVDNVVAIGNACGFVEPLEATGLMVLTGHCQAIVDVLRHSQLSPTPTMVDLYNKLFADGWDDVRDFLALHYRFNTRIDNPFWRACNHEVDVSGTQALRAFYAENGPHGLCRYLLNHTPSVDNAFGLEGYLVMLVGNDVPYAARHQPSARELEVWEARTARNRDAARAGFDAREALALLKRPDWRWFDDPAP